MGRVRVTILRIECPPAFRAQIPGQRVKVVPAAAAEDPGSGGHHVIVPRHGDRPSAPAKPASRAPNPSPDFNPVRQTASASLVAPTADHRYGRATATP